MDSFTAGFRQKDLLSVSQLDRADISKIFSWSDAFSNMSRLDLLNQSLLKEAIITSLFFENSTRTLLSFEIAVSKLEGKFIPLDVNKSSLSKGESLIDSIKNIEAAGSDLLIVRHFDEGVLEQASNQVNMGILNAGDGQNEHPTQALLDAFTLYKHFNCSLEKMLDGLRVLIVGDIKHSRVAMSNMLLLPMLGAHVTVFGPSQFLCPNLDSFKVEVAGDFTEALSKADAVMMLRVQKERIRNLAILPASDIYLSKYGLTNSRAESMKPSAVVMHPGPVNREVEIASQVVDGPRSLVLKQAQNGVFIRMAVLNGLFQYRQLLGQ